MDYINLYGLFFVFIIMIPNIAFAVAHKEGFENRYHNKYVEVLEQIGRFGCFACMIVNFPVVCKGYWFRDAKIVYLIVGIGLVFLYCITWYVLWTENSVRKSLILSIVPSVLFLESGILTANSLLIVFAVFFAPCHIIISYQNAKVLKMEKLEK